MTSDPRARELAAQLLKNAASLESGLYANHPYTKRMREAAAILSAGAQTVLREPTKAMLDAAFKAEMESAYRDTNYTELWHAMYDAAAEPQREGCGFCGGSGERSVFRSGEGPEAGSDYTSCPNCNGTGRATPPTPPADQDERKAVAWISHEHYSDFLWNSDFATVDLWKHQQHATNIAIYTDPVNIGGEKK